MDAYEEPFERKKRPGCLGFWLKRLGLMLLVLAIVAACTQAWRHHQVCKRLDETLAEIDRAEPGWRLADIEAAREQIPEEENSARVVVAAAKLLPKDWPPKDFDDLFAHLAPEEQLAPEDFAKLKRELDNVRPALKEARKLAGLPRGRHHIEYRRNVLDTRLNDQAEARRLVWLLILNAIRHDQNGDMSNALISCRAAFNSGRSLGDEPLTISQLIRTSCVISACQGVERVLAQGEPSTEELDDFSKLLQDEDSFADLPLIARGERAMWNALFEAVENGDVSLNGLAGVRWSWLDYALISIWRMDTREDHVLMLSLMAGAIANAQLPMHEQIQAERQFDQKVQEIRGLSRPPLLTGLLMSPMTKRGESSRGKHAYLRCLSAALAAERYRRENKCWPESLDKLCPQFLEAVPLDPFDGEPLCYRRLEDGIIVYAVGNDGTDDGGNLDREHPNQPGVDVGCRLWDVAKRRQPPRPKPPKQPAPPMIPPVFNPG